MENRSFQVLLTDILRRAEDAHHTYVAALPEQVRGFENSNWQEWYAKYATRELAPILSALQTHETVCETRGRTGVTFSVEGKELDPLTREESRPWETDPGYGRVLDGPAPPPFYTRQTQEEIGNEIASRFHVGE